MLGGMTWQLTCVFAAIGVLLGAAGRWVLAALPRGCRIRPGPLEVTSALLFAVVAARAGSSWPEWWLPVPVALTAFAVPLTAVDLEHMRLPDALTMSATVAVGLAVGAAAVAVQSAWLMVSAAAGAVGFFLCHWCVHTLRPASLGAGDVKLSGGLGGVLGALGWASVLVGAALAAMTTAMLALAGRLSGRRAWRDGVPHGPGLLVSTWVMAVFPGERFGVGP